MRVAKLAAAVLPLAAPQLPVLLPQAPVELLVVHLLQLFEQRGVDPLDPFEGLQHPSSRLGPQPLLALMGFEVGEAQALDGLGLAGLEDLVEPAA